MTSDTTQLPNNDRRAGRGLLLAGVAFAMLAIGMLAVQYVGLKILIIPWYAPILTAIGALLALGALARRVGAVRIIILVLLIALAGLEWFTLAVAGKLPQYTGPAQAGKTLPPFRTTLSDGSSFTDADLRDGEKRVLTFFRGRW